jgi:hypothetical protein
MRAKITIMLVISFLMMVLPIQIVHAQEVLDQSQTAFDYSYWFEDTTIRWQEFKPTLDNCTAVEIRVTKTGNPGNVVTEIRTTGATLLGQQLSQEAYVPSSGWLRVEFSEPIDLVPGTKYRIYVSSDEDSPDPQNRYFWSGTTSSTYDSGCESDVSEMLPDYDYAFKTYGIGGGACSGGVIK